MNETVITTRRNLLKSAGGALTAVSLAGLQAGCAASGARAPNGAGQSGKRDGLAWLDGMEQARLVRRGEISALELIDAAISRVEALEPRLNALAGVDFDRARTIARSVRPDHPFSGVPFVIKDLVAYPGLRFSRGSRLFATDVAQQGSAYTEAIDAAGLITLGKATTSEFGLLGATETLLEGITRNPWNLDRSPAGSSGGSAVAVASGMVPLAQATDGGGSIRIPASACGVFGLKPSRGRTISDGRGDGRSITDLLSNHCVSRSVRDSAMFLALTERGGRDAIHPPVGFVGRPDRKRLRIGLYDKTLMGRSPAPEVAEALASTALLCQQLGHIVVEAPPPPVNGVAVSDAFFVLAGAMMSGLMQSASAARGHPLGAAEFEPFTLALVDWFRGLPENAVPKALATLTTGAQEMERYLSQYDVTLSPTMATVPFEIDHLSKSYSFEHVIGLTREFAGYTPVHNQAGVPAMSVPLFWTADDLPIGSHFAAQLGGEARLLALAYELEEACPWSGRHPRFGS